MPKSLQDEIKQTKPFTSLEVEAYLNIVRTEAALSQAVHGCFKQYGITQTIYNLMRIIRGGPDEGVPCSNIADRLVARVPDVTRLVDRAVNLGLVIRTRPENDRRVVLLSLTPKGQDLLDQLAPPLDVLHRQRMGTLSEEELRTVIDLMTRLRAVE